MRDVCKPSVKYPHFGKWMKVEFNSTVAAYNYYRELVDKGWFLPSQLKLNDGSDEYQE